MIMRQLVFSWMPTPFTVHNVTLNWTVEVERVECCRKWPNRVRGVQVDAGPARHLQGRTLLTQEKINLANSNSSTHFSLSLSQ